MVVFTIIWGLRQAVMALMYWAIDVPQKLIQTDAIPNNIYISKEELIIKVS